MDYSSIVRNNVAHIRPHFSLSLNILLVSWLPFFMIVCLGGGGIFLLCRVYEGTTAG